jgi:hypothetical protein
MPCCKGIYAGAAAASLSLPLSLSTGVSSIVCLLAWLFPPVQDGMVYHHEVLEHGDFNQRQQVVRWIRRFPFAFLSDREYTIARREFREDDGSIYACTKVGVMDGARGSKTPDM